jgi:hypothetical protein
MIRAESLFVDGDGTRDTLLGIGKPVLVKRNLCKIYEDGSDIGMIGAESLLTDNENSLEQSLGFRRLTLSL